MIKAILFDMDGVLIEAKDWHYDALNRALEKFGMAIDRDAHLTTFDGLPTRRKLEMLSKTRGLPARMHGFLNDLKQAYTLEIVYAKCKPNFTHQRTLSLLKGEGYRLGVCSNSVRLTVETMMRLARLDGYLDLMLSNEDVQRPKPDPEIYTAAMTQLGVDPKETLILEDNDHGIAAARASGAHVLVIGQKEDVNYDNIRRRIDEIRANAKATAA
jgi:HAD superfamily hydrolase (TIGR01509 family)